MPIVAATRHMRCGELNIIEKPQTPMNANNARRAPFTHGLRFGDSKPCGLRCTRDAIIHPASVAIRMMHNTYITLCTPEGKSIFAISRPPVMSGKPGITNSIAPMYAVSCCSASGLNRPMRRKVPTHANAATATHTKVTKNWLR